MNTETKVQELNEAELELFQGGASGNLANGAVKAATGTK